MYQVYVDHGVAGWKPLSDFGYKSVDEAVRDAIASTFGAHFEVVRKVNWRAISRRRRWLW